MTASGGLYPSLGRHFKSMTELAHAGCMSVRRLRDCLDGMEEFTRFEKKAIAANIATKIMSGTEIDYSELQMAVEAWQGKFDDVYKRKVGAE